MSETDISEAPDRVYAAPSATDQWLRPSLTVDQIEADDVVYVRADLFTAAEAERDKALAQVAYVWKDLHDRNMGTSFHEDGRPDRRWCNICDQDWPVSSEHAHLADCILNPEFDISAAAREYRARVAEQCADIAASATITDHDNLSWTVGRRIAVEAIRAHAAGVREGRE